MKTAIASALIAGLLLHGTMAHGQTASTQLIQQEQTPRFRITGANIPCPEWVANWDRAAMAGTANKHNGADYMGNMEDIGWIEGYFAAVNSLVSAPITYPGHSPTVADLGGFVTDYCWGHPADTALQAVSTLIFEQRVYGKLQ
jgi:hypothetical protein